MSSLSQIHINAQNSFRHGLIRYVEALPDDIVKFRDAGAIIYVPIGSLEWHDTHASLGADGFIAEGLCLRLAERAGGVLLPTLHWALTLAHNVNPPYKWHAARGSLGLGKPDVWEAFLRAQVDALLEDGWRMVALVAGHTGGVEREILTRLASEHAQINQPQVAFIHPYQHVAGDHAGYFETNMLLALHPDSVRPAPSLGNPWARAPASAANARDGEQMVRECVDGALSVIQDALIRCRPLLPPPFPMLENASPPADWTARWIAPPPPTHENFYFLARASFQAGCQPESACLRIAADARYVAYLNGRRVGCGPARGSCRRYFADSYDVTAGLRPGENWLAVAVHCPVRSTFTAVPHAPGVLAEIHGLIATGAGWQARVDPAHNAAAPLYTRQLGYAEWLDLRAEPDGWTTGDDGSTGWNAACELAPASEFGGRLVCPRPVDELTWTERMPARVVNIGRVLRIGDARLADPDFADIMQSEMQFAAAAGDFENMQAVLWADGTALINRSSAYGVTDAFVILDFGREIAGHVLLDVEAGAGVIIDVGYGEALDQGRLMTRYNEYRFADRFVLRAGRRTVGGEMHSRGFRYIKLTFRRFDAPIQLHAVRAVERVYSKPAAATFCCAGDMRLTRLWKTCANTVRLCALDSFVDCIWREQAFWVIDFAVVNGYYLALTGDPKFSAHNLRLAADGIRPDGMIPKVYPDNASESIPVMPALWALSLADYHLYTGDLTLINELLPALEKALAWYDARCDSDGLIDDQPGMWNFTDWGYVRAGVALAGKTAILQMLIAAGYKRAATLADAAGRPELARAWLDRSRNVVRALNDLLWDEARGCYRDCTRPKGLPTSSQHPLAVGLAFGLLEEPQCSQADAHLLDADLIQAELFFQHFVLQALAARGRVDDGLRVITGLWGGILASDSDTIWESPDGRAAFQHCGSLCHAFSCAPVRFLQENILGVRPLRPGFAEFVVDPHPAGLLGASGAVPTPHGLIKVKWTVDNGALLAPCVEAPKQCRRSMPQPQACLGFP